MASLYRFGLIIVLAVELHTDLNVYGLHNQELPLCSNDEFRCKSGLCIPNIWFCDGHHDCLDHDDEDEDKCINVKSNGTQFQNMQTNETVPSLNENEGTVGVPDFGLITHESQICGEHSFKCSSSNHCVSERWVCDGTPDCPDRSDEHMCLHTHYSCLNLTVQGQETYLCADGFTCIPLTSICDGVDHCPDGSDEGPTCDTSCLNANCELSCMPSPVNDKGTCLCTGSYILGEDGKSCIDINECDIFGSCSQDCENIQGSYTCSCKPGYEMVRSSCKAMGEDSALLLFSSRSEIRGMYLPSERPFNISQKRVNQAVGVAYDRLTDRVYWSDLQPQHEAILSSRMDGTDMRWFLEGGKIAMAESVVVDYVARNLYYTDSIKKVVGVCAIDNPSNLTKDAMNGESNTKRMCTNILTNIDQPRGLGLYPPEGLLFYSNWGNNPHIGRAGMDGTRPEAIISKDIGWPNGIAVDIVLKRIYWSDAKHGRIETALFDGSDRRTVFFQSVQHPFSLAVFEDTLYWSDWGTQQVQSCNKFNGGDHKVLVMEPKLHGIHIYHRLLEVNHTNPCTNAKCSHLCLLAYGGNGYTCSCPSPTKWHLAEDRVTCHRRFESATTMSRDYAHSYAIYGHDVNDSRAIDKMDLTTTPFTLHELIAENSTLAPVLENSKPAKDTCQDWLYEAKIGIGVAIILFCISIVLCIIIAIKCGLIRCKPCVRKKHGLIEMDLISVRMQ